MSTEETKATVRRFIEAWNTPDLAAATVLVGENFVGYEPGHQIQGREGLKESLRMSRAGFPDLRFTIEEILAEGDRAAVRVKCEGTQRGEFQGIPATGRKVAWDSSGFLRVAGGKVVEFRAVEDMLGLMQQLGALPAAGHGEHGGHH